MTAISSPTWYDPKGNKWQRGRDAIAWQTSRGH
jgi:hypothetical protein